MILCLLVIANAKGRERQCGRDSWDFWRGGNVGFKGPQVLAWPYWLWRSIKDHIVKRSVWFRCLRFCALLFVIPLLIFMFCVRNNVSERCFSPEPKTTGDKKLEARCSKSRMRGNETSYSILKTKLQDSLVNIPDVTMYANLGDHGLRGSGAAWVKFCHSRWLWSSSVVLTTVLHYTVRICDSSSLESLGDS